MNIDPIMPPEELAHASAYVLRLDMPNPMRRGFFSPMSAILRKYPVCSGVKLCLDPVVDAADTIYMNPEQLSSIRWMRSILVSGVISIIMCMPYFLHRGLYSRMY